MEESNAPQPASWPESLLQPVTSFFGSTTQGSDRQKDDARHSQKRSQLADRLHKLESSQSVFGRAESERSTGVRAGAPSAPSAPPAPIASPDAIFSNFPKDSKGENAEEKVVKVPLTEKIFKMLWGGPVVPNDQDTVFSWIQNFMGGVTTAHGVNQAFQEDNGPCRQS